MMTSTIKMELLFSCLYGKKSFFFYLCVVVNLIKSLVCDTELVHLQVKFATSLFLWQGSEYDKYQGEEHDALLTELKESADLETIKLGIFCSSKL